MLEHFPLLAFFRVFHLLFPSIVIPQVSAGVFSFSLSFSYVIMDYLVS